MSKVKTFNVMSVLVAVFFLSNGLAFAQYWDLDGNDIVNNNAGIVKVNRLEVGSSIKLITYVPGYVSQILGSSTGNNSGILFNSNKMNLGPYPASALDIDPDNNMVEINYNLIVGNGKVGIGTNDPGNYELAVEGTIGAREVVVTQASWSDFVFEEDYKLNSLDKVESYIKKNKHLPDIPSEKEIKENGLSMADMMAKQMQKIEELTLYVIELKKENKNLSGRLASLEKDK